MKVKELINLLSLENPELEVMVEGFEGGYVELEQTRKIKATWDSEWERWFGGNPHGDEVLVLMRTT